MCNYLSLSKKLLVLQSLVEGNSIRSTERISGVHRDTIMRLLVKTGNEAQEILDARLVDIKSKFIQVDEIWSYVYKKQKNCSVNEKIKGEYGDQYIFVAIDADTKLVPYFCVGKRNRSTTYEMISQLKDRISTRFQLSTDAFPAYPDVVDEIFGSNVDFATIHKQYGNDEYSKGRYSPPKIIKLNFNLISGQPDEMKVSTSYIERQNLTMRMNMRRLTRLTNAFSKKLENLKAALSLHFFYYNFMRIHSSIRCTPAMEAGISKSIWAWEQLLGCELSSKAVA